MSESDIKETYKKQYQEGVGTWYCDSKGCITKFEPEKDVTEIEIPPTVDGIPVKRINPRTFLNYTALKKVNILGNVEIICREAFSGCTNLEELVISGVVDKIVCGAFLDCTALKEINILGTVKEIEEGAFYGCTALNKISGTVEKSDYHAFYGCTALKDIPGLEKHEQYQEGVGTWFCDGEGCIREFKPEKDEVEIEIPCTVDDIKIVGIGSRAFLKFASLKKAIIPGHVKKIGFCAFFDCTNLEEVVISESVEEIESSAFYNCAALKEVIIPGTVKIIGYNAFSGCTALEKPIISEGVEEIKSDAFSGCTALKEITVPGTVKIIDYNAFSGCTALEKLIISEGVEEIKMNAFSNCTALKEITIPGTVKIIDYNAFSGCTALEKLIISDGVEEINFGAFPGCTALREIIIPGSFGKIDFYDFNKFGALEKITILNGVKEIQVDSCKSLKELTIPESVNKITHGLRDLKNLERINISGLNNLEVIKKAISHFNFKKGRKSITITLKKDGQKDVSVIIKDKRDLERLSEKSFESNNSKKRRGIVRIVIGCLSALSFVFLSPIAAAIITGVGAMFLMSGIKLVYQAVKCENEQKQNSSTVSDENKDDKPDVKQLDEQTIAKNVQNNSVSNDVQNKENDNNTQAIPTKLEKPVPEEQI